MDEHGKQIMLKVEDRVAAPARVMPNIGGQYFEKFKVLAGVANHYVRGNDLENCSKEKKRT